MKKICAIAPSSPIKISQIIELQKIWQEKKLELIFAENSSEKFWDLAGEDSLRKKDFENAMCSDSAAVISFCGGYGSNRILREIDYSRISQQKNVPKYFGYSDATALQLALWQKAKIKTFHGFMIGSDFKNYDYSTRTWKYFQRILHDEKLPEISDFKFLRKKDFYGIILGGCLSVLTALIGTEFLPDFSHKILFLEDIGEPTYKIDRMLNQLIDAKIVANCAGIIFGEFKNCEPRNKEEFPLKWVLENFTGKVKCPIIYDFPCGHLDDKVILPFGGTAEVFAEKNKISLNY